MLTKTVEAVYINGVFRPIEPVDLADNERVTMTFEPKRRPEVARWIKSVRDAQRRAADRQGLLSDSTAEMVINHRQP